MGSHDRSYASLKSPRELRSAVVKRSVIIAGRKTSVSLEDAFWSNLKDIAHSRHMTLTDIVGYIDSHGEHANLSSTIRLFVLEYVCAQREAAMRAAAGQRSEAAGGNSGLPAPGQSVAAAATAAPQNIAAAE